VSQLSFNVLLGVPGVTRKTYENEGVNDMLRRAAADLVERLPQRLRLSIKAHHYARLLRDNLLGRDPDLRTDSRGFHRALGQFVGPVTEAKRLLARQLPAHRT